MESEEIKEIINEFIFHAEELRPIIFELVDKFGPDLKKLCLMGSLATVDIRAEMVYRFQKVHKFTRKEAIMMVLGVTQDIGKALESFNKR